MTQSQAYRNMQLILRFIEFATVNDTHINDELLLFMSQCIDNGKDSLSVANYAHALDMISSNEFIVDLIAQYNLSSDESDIYFPYDNILFGWANYG